MGQRFSVKLTLLEIQFTAMWHGSGLLVSKSEVECGIFSHTSPNDYITAPPLPPNVSLELSSWNTMTLSWNAPFTAEG